MPKIRLVRGIKSYRSKGRLYHYHRATGVRIDIDPEVDPEGFLARVRDLDGAAAVLSRRTSSSAKAVNLGDLLDAWRQSQEWQTLKSETQRSYLRVIDPNIGAIRSKRTIALTTFTPSMIVSIRDEVAQKKKRWMANYSVKVLRTAFGWGRLHGWCQSNAAEGVPLLPRPPDAAVRNRAWSSGEFEIVWDRASPRLQRALALAYYAGLRLGDVVAVPWTAWDGSVLTVRQSKTTELVQVKAPAPLREELNSARREGVHIVTNERAQPYTRDGLKTILWRLVKQLEAETLVKPGLCFHGLRHSLGAALYDLGLDREARKAALGHTSDAASMVYERGGNRKAASDRAFDAYDEHLAKAKQNAKRT
jgi:integrase